jgi:hypothetical protein
MEFKMIIVTKNVVETVFEIPKELDYLLSRDDNLSAKEGSVGSWYIKWQRFNYFDKEGKQQSIDGNTDGPKYPETIKVIEGDESGSEEDY